MSFIPGPIARRRRARSTVSALVTLAMLVTSLMAVTSPASAEGEFIQANVNGDEAGPKYIFHGWPAGEITVEVWETAAKEKLVFTETFMHQETRQRGEGPLDPGNHVVATSGSITRELTTIDIDVRIDPFEDVVSGYVPANTTISIDPPEGWEEGNGFCRREMHSEAGGAFSFDFDEPVLDPGNPTCSPTWDFVPGNAVKLTANRDDEQDGQTASIDFVVDFTDDDGTIFEMDITWLAEEGITKGCNPPTNDMFCPNDFVTRGQMAAFLVRALGYTDAGDGDLFTDDDGTIFETDIDKLATAGVTKGCNPPTNDMFCPNDSVTRGQMAAFLRRALG